MSASEPHQPRITKERLFLIVFVLLALLLALGSIFGGLDNFQRLYEAGHQDPFGQTIDDVYGTPAGGAAAANPASR